MGRYDLELNREIQRQLSANSSIRKDAQTAKTDTGFYTIVAPDPRGGWVVRGQDGGLIHGVRSQTNRGLGVGAVVSISQGTREAYLDTKPTKADGSASSGGSGSGNSTGTGTSGSTAGKVLSPFGTPSGTPTDGSTPRYRPNGNGECESVYYTGATKAGDFDDPGTCAGDRPNSKTYYCENGKCYATAPGSGRYGSKEECEAAIIQPGFTGGQCNVFYNIQIVEVHQQRSIVGDTVVSQANVPNSAGRTGPIPGLDLTYASNGSVSAASINGIPVPLIPAGTSDPVNRYGYRLSVEISSVSRADGGVDDCGSKNPSCGI